MPDDPRVQELLDRLSDSDATPEEVCGSCVELLPVVRDRWRQMCRARDELDALFPPEAGLDSEQVGAGSLPVIPGYEVEAELGHGGMGVVYRARHVRLNRLVALKMVLAGGPQERERFRREAEAAAALRHPNVVQVHDVGDAAVRPYLTMEYLDGGSLAERLEGRPLPVREAAGLVLTLTGAVEAAHTAGIVHRDLKPGNVLLTAEGTPKIADFGLARRLDGEAGLTRTGTAVGTPSYMAPEQARGGAGAVGPAADVYGLGAILYELLTGRPPFKAETAADTLHQLLTQDPVPPTRLNGKVPRDLETVCLKCLRKEPRERYTAAAALGDDLARFLAGEAVVARPEGWPALLARRVRRRPFHAAVVAVAVLATAALIGLGAWTLSDRAAARRAGAADQEAVERAAADDLADMGRLLRQAAWPEARAALERAKGRLGDRGSDALRSRLARGASDLELVARLDAIRSRDAELVDGRDDSDARLERADWEYAEAFAAAGYGGVDADPAAVAAGVAASDVRGPLLAALDNWARCGRRQRVWALTIARTADPDPTGWRDRARNPDAWTDGPVVAELVESARVGTESVDLLVILAARHQTAGGDPTGLLTELQRARPADYWANHSLGLAVAERNPGEAVRYLQAAVAARPGAAVAHSNLGIALRQAGRPDDAIECYRAALRIDPRHAKAHANLALALRQKGRLYDSLDSLQRAVGLDPNLVQALRSCGRLLADMGRTEEAIARYRQAIRTVPGYAGAHHDLGVALDELGRSELAGAAYREAARLDPRNPRPRLALGIHLRETGRYEEARREAQSALDLLPASDPLRATAEHEVRACDQYLQNEKGVRALLQRNGNPGSAREALFVAEMCRAWSRHRTAARYYHAAFAAARGSGEGLYPGQRFAAACSTLLAAQGVGADAGASSADDRAAFRRQARLWLRAEYEARLARQAAGPKEWQAAVRTLRTWHAHAELAAAWSPEALARLDDDERRAWQALGADVTAAAARDPFMTVEQARAYAARADWARASEAYARAIREGPTDDAEVWFESAAVRALAGDRPGHGEACGRMLAGVAAGATTARPYLAARACTLTPDGGPDRERAAEASRDELTRNASAHWSLTQQAALLVRSGRCREAVPLLERSLQADARPGTAVVSWLWLALAHHRLGDPGEAGRWRARATAWLDQQGEELSHAAQTRGCHLHNWLESHAVRREVEATVH